MFFRKLISTSLIIAASIGSSIAVGADAEDVLRVSSENVESASCVVFVLNVPGHRLTASEELKTELLILSNILIEVVIGDDNSQFSGDSLDSIMLKSNNRAQSAERKADQINQRKVLRRVSKSFKAPVKSLHQPR
jgi:hypothetical protein